ncbi:MAG: DMT family transporter [Planctomycetes bacterium]|nr:DMT family transporter [Planctomycetota bacterium]
MINEGKIRQVDLSATFACIGALSFWSLGPIFIKYLTGYLDSWTQNLLRYSVACLLWMPFLIFSIKKGRLNARVWRRAVVPGVANVVMQSLFACAFYYIGPAFMVLLAKSSLIWITSFSLIFFVEERALVKSKRFWSGLLLSITGVIGVMCFKEDFSAAGTITGIALTLGMAFMWAVYILSVRIAFRDIDSRHGFSVISIYTVAGLFVLGCRFGDLGDCVKMGAKQWVFVVISGATAIALSHTLYYSAMRRIGATIPALVMLTQPFIVLAISNVVFKESLNIFQLLFGVVLLAGSGLAIWAQEHLKRRS